MHVCLFCRKTHPDIDRNQKKILPRRVRVLNVLYLYGQYNELANSIFVIHIKLERIIQLYYSSKRVKQYSDSRANVNRDKSGVHSNTKYFNSFVITSVINIIITFLFFYVLSMRVVVKVFC